MTTWFSTYITMMNKSIYVFIKARRVNLHIPIKPLSRFIMIHWSNIYTLEPIMTVIFLGIMYTFF